MVRSPLTSQTPAQPVGGLIAVIQGRVLIGFMQRWLRQHGFGVEGLVPLQQISHGRIQIPRTREQIHIEPPRVDDAVLRRRVPVGPVRDDLPI